MLISYLSKYIAGLYRQSKIDINQAFQDYGLRATEGDLLLFIYDNPGLSQKKIATLMVLDPSLIGRDIQRLIAAGYVQRRLSKTDNRVNEVFLTVSGEHLVSQLRLIITDWWRKLFEQTDQADSAVIDQQLVLLYQTIIQRNS